MKTPVSKQIWYLWDFETPSTQDILFFLFYSQKKKTGCIGAFRSPKLISCQLESLVRSLRVCEVSEAMVFWYFAVSGIVLVVKKLQSHICIYLIGKKLFFMIPYVFTVLRSSPGYVDFYLDISKALNTIFNGIILEKLTAGRLVRCAHCWVKNWMDSWADRAMVAGDKSSWRLVKVVFPRAQYWDQPFLMSLSAIWMRGYNAHWVSYFADNTKLGKSVNLL